ncbi:hypothetical protein KJ855_01210 [Patescibacteria group bacterium]|nr:hypothetical protein [Patescibacteria group bacterium]
MKKINIFLYVVLVVLTVVIVVIAYQNQQRNNSVMIKVNDYQDSMEDFEKNLVESDQKKETKKVDVDKNVDDVDDNDVDNVEVKKDTKKEVVVDDDLQDSKEDDDKDGEDKEDDDKKHVYRGVLMEAEEDNEYGGNYKLIDTEDTSYTYFWFDGDMSDYQDKLVEIEVEFDDDGYFSVVGWPDLVED